MTWLALALALVLVTLGVLALVGARHRAIARERRRAAELAELAARLGRIQAAFARPVPSPDPPPRPPSARSPVSSGGRVALLDAVSDAVERARADGSRLAVARVEAPPASAASLADDVRAVAGAETYDIGTRSVALVVPGAGRADALGVLARIQAVCGATGTAVELEPGEGAIELVVRLLGPVADGG